MRAARLIGSLVAAALAGGCGGGPDRPAPGEFDEERAFADVEAQVALGPRPSGSPGSEREVAYIVRELRRAGVRQVEVQRPHANVVGKVPGTEPGAIVAAAHHDTKDDIPGFLGANDGASGVALLLELARSLDPPLAGPSIHLAFFDAEEARGERPFEEDGTRGSRQYVQYAGRGGEQGSPLLSGIRAMVLFDMVGDCDLQIPLESNSEPALYERFSEAAEEVSGGAEPFTGTTTPIGDDHLPFTELGIPALDLIDFTYGAKTSPGPYWHTPEDTLDKVCPGSLDAVGEAAVLALGRLG